MRILLVSHTCISRTDGQPKAVCLAAMPDVELQVLVPDRWYQYGAWHRAETPETGEFECTIGRVALPWTGPMQWYLHWYPQMAEILRKFRPDIIDLWEEPWGLVSAQTCLLRNRLAPQAQIVAETEQNIDKRLPPPFEQFRAYTLRNTSHAVGRSAEAIEVLRRKGYAGPATVVPNAVDISRFRVMDREACRAQWKVQGFTVGYVGRLVPEKGIKDVFEALAQCPPDVRLLLVGGGPQEPDLRESATRAGLGDRVTFLGPRPSTDLPSIMNAMDALVLPSRTTRRWKEQFGRVIIEAHACGVPVIGSNSGAIPDVVGAGGLIFPEGDAQALAEAIHLMRASPSGAAEYGEVGRKKAESTYTWESVAAAMRGVYLTTLGAHDALTITRT